MYNLVECKGLDSLQLQAHLWRKPDKRPVAAHRSSLHSVNKQVKLARVKPK
jgi:hypothetical protein